ncbi:ABC transporter substrate-binding protein [Cohnella yongneupensis]|uniref:ABC transporter substrate-binding protein n=1 Tax=Cohnella yongneupensis TaxID=425006 RepID=A0ABW0R5Z0_9BACL
MSLMRKKSTAIAATMVLASSLTLAACGDKNSGNDSNGAASPAGSSPAASQSASGAASLKPYNLTMYFPGSAQPDQKKVEAKMNEYLKDKINATIELKPIDWGAWGDKMNLMIASGEEADIIFTAAWNGYSTNVAKGAFLPLDELLQSNGQDILKTLDPLFLEGSKINGKNYGVPTNKELAATKGLALRKDIVEKYNIDLSQVKTIADMEPIFKLIKEKEPKMIPYYMFGPENGVNMINQWDYMGDSSVPGIVIKDQTSTQVVNELDLPETKERINMIRDWYLKGYINQDAATTKVFPGDQMKAGNVFAKAESLKPGKDAELTASTGLPWIQIELAGPTISTGDTTGSMLAISRTSGDPERAMMFINLLHTDKYLNNLLNFGIEGEHYDKKSDEVIDTTKGAKTYNLGSSWMFGNQFLNYLQPNEDPQKWDKFKAFNASGKASPAIGFTFDSEPVKSEIAAVVNVNSQYQTALYTGSVDPEEAMAKYTAKLKDAGVDKIIAEKQKQLDAYLASKK